MSLNNLSTLQFNYNLNGLQDISSGQGNVLPVASGSNITVVNDTTQYIVNLNDNISIDSINASSGTFTYLSATNFTGSTGSISNLSTNQIQFNTNYTPSSTQEGLLYWDNEDKHKTLNLVMANGIEQEVGQESFFRVKCFSPITKGQVVMFAGTQGSSNALLAKPAYGLTVNQGTYIMGVAAESGVTNDWIYITEFGLVTNLDTRGQNGETWVDGTILYYNPSVTGALTQYIPTGPNVKVEMAAVVHAVNNGSIFVRPTFNPSLNQINNVRTSGEATNDLLIYDTNVWKNQNRNIALNGISLTGAGVYNLTGTNANITNITTVSLTGTNMSFTGASLGHLTVTGKTPLNLAISQTDSSAGNSFNGYCNFNEKTFFYGNMAMSYMANHTNPLNAILYSIGNDTVLSCTANASSRIYFRPQGYLTSTNEAYIGNTGQLVCQSINTGLVTCTDNTITNGLEIQGRRSGTSKSIYQSDVTGINDFRGNTNNYGSNYFLGGAGTIVNFSPTVAVNVEGTITSSSGAFTKLSATNATITNFTGTNINTNFLTYITSTGTTSHVTTLNGTTANVTTGNITNVNSTTINGGTITASTLLYAPSRILGKHVVSDSLWIGMTGSGLDSSRVAIGIEGLTDGTGLIQNLRFRTNNAQRMIIDNNGLIGIGRTPSYILDINSTMRVGENGTSSYLINLGQAGVGSFRSAYIFGDGTQMEINNQQAGNLLLSTNNGEKMRITSAGNVGIGVDPLNKLDVNGTSRFRSNTFTYGAIENINTVNNAFANGMFFRKERPGGVLGNNELGYIYMGGYDSTNINRNTVLIYAGSEDTFTPTSCPSYLAFFTTPTTANSPTERMRIRANGNVGVGVINPNSKFQVNSAQTAGVDIVGQGLTGNVCVKDSGSSVYNGGSVIFGASQGNFGFIKGGITDGGSETAGQLNFGTRTNAATANMTNRMTLYNGLHLGETTTQTSYRLELERINNTAYYPNAVFTQDSDANFSIAATPGSRVNTTDEIVGQIGLLYKSSPVATTYISSGMRFYRGAGANDSYYGLTTNSNTLRYLCDTSGFHYFGMLTDTPSISTTNNTHNFRSQAYTNGVGTSKCLSKGDGNFVARARFDYAGATTYTVAGGRVKIQGSNGSNTNHSAWQNPDDNIKLDWTGVYKLHLNINLFSSVGTQAAIYIYDAGAVIQTTWMECPAGKIVTCNATAVIEGTRNDLVDVRIEPQTASVNVNNESIAWITFEG